MSRRMSCALTIDAVRDRSKTVTRRNPDTWSTLAAGDRLTLIEKGMGLPAGAKQVVLAEVEVISNTIELLGDITPAEVIAEGFPHMTTGDFMRFWADAHGHADDPDYGIDFVEVRRIEWRYLG